VHVTVAFPSASPSAGQLAAAREELGRLVVPSCPAALPLLSGSGLARKAARTQALRAVEAFALDWLPSHYPGDPSDVAGATAVAALGAAMPRHGEAAADCGPRVAARSVEVDVTLPKLATVSASLSELSYFVARTAHGWQVWERAR